MITTGADGARSVFAADIDGDGDLDVLSASIVDDTIAWYDNVNGDGSAWSETKITTTADGARSVFAADLDGDGDLDVLSASFNDDTIALYRNGDGVSGGGDGSAWGETEITTGADGAASVFAADLDGDGDLDVLSASVNDDTIAWYENVLPPALAVTTSGDAIAAGGTLPLGTVAPSAARDTVFTLANAPTAEVDLTVTSVTLASGASYTLTPPAGGLPLTLAPGTSTTFGLTFTGSAAEGTVADDVTIASDDPATPSFTFGVETLVRDPLTLASTTPARNALDVAAGAAVTLTFGRAVDAATVTPQTLVVTGSQSGLAVGTFTGGGTATLAFAPSAPFLPGETVTVTATRGLAAQDNGGRLAAAQTLTYTVAAADAPADVWSSGVDLTTSADGARSVYSADIDGDGDLDVVSASIVDGTIAWYDNVNGDGSAWSETVITTGADGATSVFAADIDGDGDLDVLSASLNDDTIALYRNGDATSGDGDGSAWTKIAITTTADGAVSVFAADIDGDGDLDVLSASLRDDTIALYRNGDATSGAATAVRGARP